MRVTCQGRSEPVAILIEATERASKIFVKYVERRGKLSERSMDGSRRCVYTDENSEIYKSKIRKINQDAHVGDFGHISLPCDIRKEFKSTDLVEYWKISDSLYVITVTKSSLSRGKTL